MKNFFEGDFFSTLKRIFDDISGKLSYITNPGKNVILKAFIAIIALLAALSLAFVVIEIVDTDDNSTTTTEQSTQSIISEVISPNDEKQLQSNILFCLDNEKGDIHLLFLLQLDSIKNKANIIFLHPESVCEASEMTVNLNTHKQKGGITQLIMAVEKYTSFTVNRYVSGDEKDLTNFAKEIGDVEVDVKESISYDHDGLSYIIDSGKQLMTADVLLKYIIYLSDNMEENTDSICQIVAMFAQKLFDCESSQQAQDNFGSVVGFFDTNISAMDFSENKGAVMKLAHEFMLKLRPVKSLAELATLENE